MFIKCNVIIDHTQKYKQLLLILTKVLNTDLAIEIYKLYNIINTNYKKKILKYHNTLSNILIPKSSIFNIIKFHNSYDKNTHSLAFNHHSEFIKHYSKTIILREILLKSIIMISNFTFISKCNTILDHNFNKFCLNKKKHQTILIGLKDL